MFNLSEIDSFLSSLEGSVDDDDLRRRFDNYSACFDFNVPDDPFSAEYRMHQMALYNELHGKPYQISNDCTSFDVDDMSKTPFPYIHGSFSTVGDQLMGIGFLIKAMRLPKGSRILEFGPGWGNTTLALAKMGYEVHAIDVEQNFVDLINERARMECIDTLKVEKGNFFDIEKLPAEYFDAVLFYECFHHCDDHLRLIAGFDRVIKPAGIVCFAAEPINEDFPLPWGLRMDGQSLWAIRKNGWMELGFNIEYFRKAMLKFGWDINKKSGKDGPLSSVLIARRTTESLDRWNYSDAQLRNSIGLRDDVDGVATSNGCNGYLMYGPYVAKSAGKYTAVVDFSENFEKAGDVIVDIVSQGGKSVHAKVESLVDDVGFVRIPFELTVDVDDLEVRILCNEGTKISVSQLTIALLSE